MMIDMSNSNRTQNRVGANRAGFTLIELMIAMAIGLMVMAAIYSVYTGLMRSYTAQNVAADVQQNVRAGIGLMAEDIMMAGLNPERVTGIGIEVANSTKLRFTLDRNLNGDIDNLTSPMQAERITFEFKNGSLVQILNESVAGFIVEETFFDNVQNLTFTYQNKSGGTPATLADIRMVVIALTIQAPAGLEGMVDRTYTTRIRCRNIGI